MGDRKAGLEDRKSGAEAFIRKAEQDLRSSKNDLEDGIYSNSCYNAEQTSEKAIKAILILEEKFSEVHKVANILKKLIKEKSWNKNEKLIKAARELEKYWNIPRYPDPYRPEDWNPVEDITEEEAENAVEKASFVLSSAKSIIKERYGLDFDIEH